jgi:hypothetical protein
MGFFNGGYSVGSPYYLLLTSKSSVNFGEEFFITFKTNQIGNFSYTITGVNSEDIDNVALTGTFTSSGQTRTFTNKTLSDKTLQIALNNGLASAAVAIKKPLIVTANFNFALGILPIGDYPETIIAPTEIIEAYDSGFNVSAYLLYAIYADGLLFVDSGLLLSPAGSQSFSPAELVGNSPYIDIVIKETEGLDGSTPNTGAGGTIRWETSF